MIGLEFHERMAGTWQRLEAPGETRAMEFTVHARVGALRELLGDTVATLDGEVSVQGLATRTPLVGTLGLGALVRARRLPYRFRFRGDDGAGYRFDGSKEVALLDFARTMTVLPGHIYDARDQEVGRALLRFDLRHDLVGFLRSWRPLLRLARWV